MKGLMNDLSEEFLWTYNVKIWTNIRAKKLKSALSSRFRDVYYRTETFFQRFIKMTRVQA